MEIAHIYRSCRYDNTPHSFTSFFYFIFLFFSLFIFFYFFIFLFFTFIIVLFFAHIIHLSSILLIELHTIAHHFNLLFQFLLFLHYFFSPLDSLIFLKRRRHSKYSFLLHTLSIYYFSIFFYAVSC